MCREWCRGSVVIGFAKLHIQATFRAEIPRCCDVFASMIEHGEVVNSLCSHVNHVYAIATLQT